MERINNWLVVLMPVAKVAAIAALHALLRGAPWLAVLSAALVAAARVAGLQLCEL